jgi:hypothetical protein
MGHLHGRRIGITVDRDHFNAIALQLENNFFSELTGSTKQNPESITFEGSTNSN